MLPNRPSVIILAPSKELVSQIFTVAKGISHHAKLKIERVDSAANWKITKKSLEEGVDVLVTNSNKLARLLKEGRIALTNLRYLVIDEADVFLETGDEPDLTRILRQVYLGRETDERVQLLFVSATLTPKLRIFLDSVFDRKTKYLVTTDAHFNLANLSHQFVPAQNNDRLELLISELESFRKHSNGFYFLVFCNSMKAVRAVTYALKSRGIDANSLHSDMPLRLRAETYQNFRDKKINILVCTDLVARGLDFSHLTGVLNFDCPKNVNDYIHRAGRAGRIGNVGTVVSFYKNEDLPLIDRLRQSSEKGIPLELTQSSFALTKRKEAGGQVPSRRPNPQSNVPDSYRRFAERSTQPVFAPKKTRTKSVAGKRAPQFTRRKIIDIKASIKRQNRLNPGSKRVKYLKAATRRLHKQELVRKGKLVLPPYIIKRINRQKQKRS
jgi:superfamily II DNA/RNA helicase